MDLPLSRRVRSAAPPTCLVVHVCINEDAVLLLRFLLIWDQGLKTEGFRLCLVLCRQVLRHEPSTRDLVGIGPADGVVHPPGSGGLLLGHESSFDLHVTTTGLEPVTSSV